MLRNTASAHSRSQDFSRARLPRAPPFVRIACRYNQSNPVDPDVSPRPPHLKTSASGCSPHTPPQAVAPSATHPNRFYFFQFVKEQPNNNSKLTGKTDSTRAVLPVHSATEIWWS